MLLDEAIACPLVSAAIKLDVALIDDVVMNLDRSEVAADSFIAVQLHDDLSLMVGYANVRHAMVDDAALLTIPCANDAGNERIWDPIPELMAGSTVVVDSASRIESEPMPTSIPTAEQEPAPNNAGELQYDTHAVPVTPPEGGTESRPASPSALIASFVDRITAPIPEPIIKTPRIRVPRRRVQPETLRRSIRLAPKTQSRLHNPEQQAERVLLKKLGLCTEAEITDPGSFSQLKSILDGPIDKETQEAFDALFPEDGYNGPALLEANA
jgi:hypothetical protein